MANNETLDTASTITASVVNLLANPDIAFTTLGTKVSWCWEKTAGVRPGSSGDATAKYAILYDCTKSPALGAEADKAETTPLIAKNNKSYVSLLQDMSNNTIECNWTSSVINLHAAWLLFALNARKKGLRLWLCVDIASSPKSYFIPVYPSNMTLDALEANTAPKYIINFDVQGDVVTDSDPTYINDEGINKLTYWKYNVSETKFEFSDTYSTSFEG